MWLLYAAVIGVGVWIWRLLSGDDASSPSSTATGYVDVPWGTIVVGSSASTSPDYSFSGATTTIGTAVDVVQLAVVMPVAEAITDIFQGWGGHE